SGRAAWGIAVGGWRRDPVDMAVGGTAGLVGRDREQRASRAQGEPVERRQAKREAASGDCISQHLILTTSEFIVVTNAPYTASDRDRWW
ncbi:unnamed protein product, partial [Urochloa humidicola]